MAAASLFSLPLLVLHVSRVLGLKFALTRVVPLAAFTLGLVVNGVYGGGIRDYVFVAAAIFVIAYVTVSYEGWAAGHDKRRQELEEAYMSRLSVIPVRPTSWGNTELCDDIERDAEAVRDRIVIPVHLLEKREQTITFFCTKCGARMTTLPGMPAPEKSNQ
jgi:hypothetical protein